MRLGGDGPELPPMGVGCMTMRRAAARPGAAQPARRGRARHQGGLRPLPRRPAGGRPEKRQAAARASLQRLGVDAVDLLYLHRVDPEVPVEENVGALDVHLSKADLAELHRIAPPARRSATASPLPEWS
jgi:hypothetical protein